MPKRSLHQKDRPLGDTPQPYVEQGTSARRQVCARPTVVASVLCRRRARLLSSFEFGDRCTEKRIACYIRPPPPNPTASPPFPTHTHPSHPPPAHPGSYPVSHHSTPPQSPHTPPSLFLPLPPSPHHNDGSSWQAIILRWAPSTSNRYRAVGVARCDLTERLG